MSFIKDFLAACLVYVPAYSLGRYASGYIDPFICGWIVSGIAIAIRLELDRRKSANI